MLSDPGSFTPLNNLKQVAAGQNLQQLLEIRYRRLHEVHDSPNRMQTVCDQIPTTFPDNLECVAYHRQCYQRFTGNLNRLQDKGNQDSSSSQSHQQQRPHSLRKSTGLTCPLFPPECIFCQKIEIKAGSNRKT